MTSPKPFTNRVLVLMVCLFAPTAWLAAQDQRTDTVPTRSVDTVTHPIPGHTDSVERVLRIKNLNPYFTLHVDSTLTYRLEINKDESKFYWYLRNSPVGLRINKDNGTLTFKAEKSYFLSGKLRYDNEYRVNIGVQSLDNPTERVDTSFAIVFYNTEIVPAKVKPSVSSTVTIEEGDTLSFKVQCEFGSFPIDNITFLSNMPIKNYTSVKKCEDDFVWSPPFDFVKESDPGKERVVLLSFIGSNRFMVRDTAVVRVIVKDALNYPFALQEFNLAARNISTYILQLKYTFVQLDKGVKKTKGARTGFDITSSTTALTGTILTSSTSTGAQQTGKILPSVGVSLVPIKEAVAPQKVFDQNQASSIRSSIKRLDYMLQDNAVVGERDPDIAKKTTKLKDELKQIQIQLIDIPLEMTRDMSEKDLNEYFNSPKVNKKYRLKK